MLYYFYMLKEEFLNKLKQKYPYSFSENNYLLIPNEFKTKNKIPIVCLKHGVFEQRADHCLSGHKCDKCARDRLNDLKRSCIQDFIHKANLIHNNKYDYSKSKYINSDTKLLITCPIHGDFEQIPYNHLIRNGCPRCRDSKGEKYISQILNNFNIKYFKEYKIKDYKYRYDFYLPDYDIYIEYHGIQHYKKDKFFGGKKKFITTQRNDKTKIELIKRSTGLLIILSYKLNTKEQIEDELIRLFSYIHPKFIEDVNTTKQAIIDSNIYLIDNGIVYERN